MSLTKSDILTRIGQRLGETSTDFLNLLSPIFDDVLSEMASNDCIRSLNKTATFTFTASTQNYSTRTITGLASPDYPIMVKTLRVPAWGYLGGMLEQVGDLDFDKWRLTYTDSSGNPVTGRPVKWRVYPNETQLQVVPVPDANSAVDTVEILYVAPPTVLGNSDVITEIRAEHIPALTAGVIKHGAVFLAETEVNVDATKAEKEWAAYLFRMKQEMVRPTGRRVVPAYRDL